SDLSQESANLPLIAEVEHVRVARPAVAFEEGHRCRWLLAGPHSPEAVVQLGGLEADAQAVTQQKRRRDPLVGRVQSGGFLIAQGGRIRNSGVRRGCERHSVSPPHYRPGRAKRLPRKAEPGTEVVPVGKIQPGFAESVPPQELHYARSSTYRVHLRGVE